MKKTKLEIMNYYKPIDKYEIFNDLSYMKSVQGKNDCSIRERKSKVYGATIRRFKKYEKDDLIRILVKNEFKY